MRLEDELGITSLKDMSTDELRAMLRTIRCNRTTEDTLVQRTKKKKTKKDAADFLKKLSPEELAKLRSLLLAE